MPTTQPKETEMRHDPTARFVLSAGDISDTFYQPAEGGWRALTDGPLRHDSNGMRRTYKTLDEAAAAVRALADEA